MKHSRSRRSFPFILYDILSVNYTFNVIKQNKENHSIITWNSKGNGFIIKNITSFTRDVIPAYFKSRLVSSFIRQLSLYSFHKVQHEPEEESLEYVNDLFTKASKANLALIKRKPQTSPDANSSALRSELYSKEANDSAVDRTDSSKLSYEELQLLTREIAQRDSHINKGLSILNEKVFFLSYCNSELITRRTQLQKGLGFLREREKYLEKVFYYLMQTYCPSIKIFSTILLDHRLDIPSLVEIDISEFVSQILTQIQRNWDEKSILEPPKDIPKSIIESIEKGNLKKLMTFCKLSTKSTCKESALIENEIHYCSQLLQFQEHYLSSLSRTPIDPHDISFLHQKTARSVNDNASGFA